MIRIPNFFKYKKYNILLYFEYLLSINYNILLYTIIIKKMDYQKKLGELLRKERESLDLTLTEVSKKMDFNHYQTLSSIEVGEREVKAWELAKLAKIYGRDIDYFLTLESSQEKSRILWRSPETSPEKKRIEQQFLLICQRYQKLMELLGENEETNISLKFKIDKHELLSNIAFKYVEKLASHYVDILKLGSRPAYSLIKILEGKMGIKIIFLPMSSDISEGCTKDHHFGSAVLLNGNNAPWRHHFDLGHEFFHLITWEIFTEKEIHQLKTKGERRVEQLADVFASSLLLPEKEVRDEFEKRIDDESITYLDLVHMARDFVIPIEALLLRMVNIGLMDKEKIQKGIYNGSINDFDKKHHYWDETAKPHLSDRYISLAIKAFFLGKITKETLAEYVDESYSAIPSFLKKYGYDENEDYSIEYRTH